MALRGGMERLRQTVAFELGGLCLAAPAHALVTGGGMGGSTGLIAAISVAVLIWAPLYNTAFDWLDWRLAGWRACQRPMGLRLIHAALHEVSALVVTVPIILALTAYTLREVAMLNIALSLFYAVYAWIFHLAFDRLRPVRPAQGRSGGVSRPEPPAAASGPSRRNPAP